jgi:MFS family permease
MDNSQETLPRPSTAPIRQALISSPAYRTFWSARTLSFLGDAMANVALVLIAAQPRPGLSAAWAVSALLLAQTLPQTLGPFVGIIADRMDRRRLMISVTLVQALLVTLIAIPALPFAVTLVLVAALFLLAAVFLPASQSVLPAILPADLLRDANTWLRVGLNVGLAIGPAIAGFLLLVAGAPVVLLLDACSFALAALLLARLPHLPPHAACSTAAPAAVAQGLATVRQSLQEGLRYLWTHPIARAVALGLFLVTLFIALDNVGLIFLARQSLGAGNTGYSFLLSAWGVGMIVGPLLFARLGRNVQMDSVYWLSAAGMGIATLACGLAPTIATAVLCQLLVGSSNGVENISYDTLLQRSVPADLRGRVFGATYSAPYLALLITYSAGGELLRLTSPRVVFVFGGIGTFVSALLLRALLSHRSVRQAG